MDMKKIGRLKLGRVSGRITNIHLVKTKGKKNKSMHETYKWQHEGFIWI